MPERLPEKIVGEVIKLKKAGLSRTDIARTLKIGTSSVWRILDKNNMTDFVEHDKAISEEETKMEITKLELPEKKEIKSDIDAKFDEIDSNLKKMKEDMQTLFETQKGIVEYLKKA